MITVDGLGAEVGHAGQAVGVRLVVDDGERVEVERAEHLGQRLGGAERGEAQRPSPWPFPSAENTSSPPNAGRSLMPSSSSWSSSRNHTPGLVPSLAPSDGAGRDRVLQHPGQLGQGPQALGQPGLGVGQRQGADDGVAEGVGQVEHPVRAADRPAARRVRPAVNGRISDGCP